MITDGRPWRCLGCKRASAAGTRRCPGCGDPLMTSAEIQAESRKAER